MMNKRKSLFEYCTTNSEEDLNFKTIDELYDITLSEAEVNITYENYLDDYERIENEFRKITKLDKLDIKFLFFATALQCLRQHTLVFKERVDHKTSDKNVKKGIKESSDRSHKWYNPSLEEIISNPVPFDAMFGSKDYNLGIGGGFGHRAKTLGHDPLLGWIFGTMNIATSTLTTYSFESYHIKTGYTVDNKRRDKISNRASTEKVFKYSVDKLMSGNEGRMNLATSLIKEYIHLKSDINTIAGLPIPIVSTVSPKLAEKLANYGFDTANLKTVVTQASGAMIINFFIGMIHRMLYDETKEHSIELYEVKTRKILSYSNLLASTSNVIYVAINAYIGNTKEIRKLDVGGLLVTLYRLISDDKFIHKIKKEFIETELHKKINLELLEEKNKTEELLKNLNYEASSNFV
ncbi:hypothetical protein [Cetobacterium sp.]|uniref:hypothetical protein n=1 Tax=Cetobacterium sp. TaxID=2071632 RepID=UPI002FCA177A